MCFAGSVISRAIILDRLASAAAAAESANSASNVINLPAIEADGGHCGNSDEWFSSRATTTAAKSIGAKPSAELVMGRKKIQIAQIADERNRQVNHCN